MVEINVDKIKIDKFAQSTQEMDKRIARLYENVVKKPVMSHEMPEALTELSWASQSVHFAIEELYHQHEQLEETKKLYKQSVNVMRNYLRKHQMAI